MKEQLQFVKIEIHAKVLDFAHYAPINHLVKEEPFVEYKRGSLHNIQIYHLIIAYPLIKIYSQSMVHLNFQYREEILIVGLVIWHLPKVVLQG